MLHGGLQLFKFNDDGDGDDCYHVGVGLVLDSSPPHLIKWDGLVLDHLLIKSDNSPRTAQLLPRVPGMEDHQIAS